MSAPVTPEALATRASSLYQREWRAWAVDPGIVPALDVPLHPPAQTSVIADVDGAIAWIESWREASRIEPVEITWATRKWAHVGTQTVPERVRVESADAVAALAGRAEDWKVARARVGDLRGGLLPSAAYPSAFLAALKRHAGTIADMPGRDFGVLAEVVRWLARNPASGRAVRELPIRGIDSKWIEKRRSLVASLVCAVTGRESLGLAVPPLTVRMRLLDVDLAVGGLTDVTAPATQLAALDLSPRVVLVVENQQTFAALPAIAGGVAILGGGYAVVERLAPLPWLAGTRIVYWGDLDSHGLAILDAARSTGLEIESVLMDADTLIEHRDLWVDEPQPADRELTRLTAREVEAYEVLRAHGWPRLEQERVDWQWVLEALEPLLQ